MFLWYLFSCHYKEETQPQRTAKQLQINPKDTKKKKQEAKIDKE